jgi:hypothetical protein
MAHPSRAHVLVVFALCSASCSAPRTATPVAEAKLQVVDIAVGRAVGADKRVTEPAGTFAAGDTIYTSVVTRGEAPRAVLAARWMREGAVFEQTEQRIATDGTATSEFHVFNPAGWAPGQYRVEILIDGRVVGDRAFRVEAAS